MKLFHLLILLLLPLFSYGIENVKIGVLAKRSADITHEKYSDMATYLSEQIEGYHFEIVPLSFAELGNAVKNKRIDFVLTNTMYYVELEYRYGVSRIATLKNISSGGNVLTSFGGVILTKQDSGITSLEDLKNRRFGAVDINSFGGWVMARKLLLDAGITPNDFASLTFFGSHDAVLKAIKEGRIDAGTVRTDTFERMSAEGRIHPELCRVIAPRHYDGFPFVVSTTLYPEWPFAKLASTPKELSHKVLIALLQMPQDSQAARSANISGWTIPLDYSSVHDLLKELKLGPYAELSKITISGIFEQFKHWILVFLIVFATIIIFLIYISRLNHILTHQKKHIELLNTGLENKVSERTHELKRMMLHEKYLKETIKTIASVNDILVTSSSVQTVLQNILNGLTHHQHYCFLWIGLLHDDEFEVAIASDTTHLLSEPHYIKHEAPNFHIAKALEAIKTKNVIIEKIPLSIGEKLCAKHDASKRYWLACFPFSNADKQQIFGTLSVISNRHEGFEAEEINMLENLASDIGLTIHTIRQRSAIEAMELAKISNYEETILAFVNIIEQRDSYTAGHTLRVAHYSRLIAQAMWMDETQIKKLEKAAILHDIGKVVTPDAILLKPGKLNMLEYELIKQHSEAGYLMLSRIEIYKDLAEIIRYHHVHYDGKGYPELSNQQLEHVPILSHILSIADAFDAMTSTRIYKTRKTVPQALDEIMQLSGTQFHPDIAKVAAQVLQNVTINETSQLPSNDLEERRFAYFFRDPLTDLYNENYLNVILARDENRENLFLNYVSFKNFSQYNKKYGWNAGNKVLQLFATTLQERCNNALLFRYHGDHFIILFNDSKTVDIEMLRSLPFLSEAGIGLQYERYPLQDVTSGFDQL